MYEPTTTEHPVGYRNPPASGRFVKGTSGNPKGRPKGSGKKKFPYETVLSRKMTVTENGVPRQVTAAEAMLLHIAKEGLKGETHEAKQILAAMATVREKYPALDDTEIHEFRRISVTPGNPNRALYRLRMAQKVDPLAPSCKTMLEPWLVEAALAQLGEKHLGLSEQQHVLAVTLEPHKVNWPQWWQAKVES